jgi:hypothetical protein
LCDHRCVSYWCVSILATEQEGFLRLVAWRSQLTRSFARRTTLRARNLPGALVAVLIKKLVDQEIFQSAITTDIHPTGMSSATLAVDQFGIREHLDPVALTVSFNGRLVYLTIVLQVGLASLLLCCLLTGRDGTGGERLRRRVDTNQLPWGPGTRSPFGWVRDRVP